MTGEKFLTALNGIDDRFITEYQECSVKKNHTIYRRLAPIAACFAVAVCAAVGYNHYTNNANPPVKPNTTENTPVNSDTTEASEAAPTVSSNQPDDDYKKYINREGSIEDDMALCFSIDTKSISGDEALKNPDLAKYLPKSEFIKIQYVHYVPKFFEEHEPSMFVEGTVISDDNREVRFMVAYYPRNRVLDKGFSIKEFPQENFEWGSVLEQATSVFGDGYSFACHSDKVVYNMSVSDTQKDVLFKLLDSLK